MTDANVAEIFRTGRVRRWHAHPEVSHTEDYNDGHQGRVARLLLALHPKPSLLLIAAALTHDDGELATGDLPSDFKRDHPELREAIRAIEHRQTKEIWGCSPTNTIDEESREWLKFADRLDGHMWVKRYVPEVLKQHDWQVQILHLREFAKKHGILEALEDVL